MMASLRVIQCERAVGLHIMLESYATIVQSFRMRPLHIPKSHLQIRLKFPLSLAHMKRFSTRERNRSHVNSDYIRRSQALRANDSRTIRGLACQLENRGSLPLKALI